MFENLKDKVILVTGGTGSFGKNFIKHLCVNSRAKKIIIFSRDELKQSQMRQEIKDERLRFFLGDVRDLPRLQRAFSGVDIVIHAAALKQVPTLEYNPFEAVKTNILGSQNVIDAAIDQKVEKVILISTDKAAQPINLYGSTKLCAEKLFINGNAYSGVDTKFSCVRYGNVVGSRGSIVDILKGTTDTNKVYITHEEMTRFWLPINDSFNLVLFALNYMQGGEIFIPKVYSMKIIDVFESLAPNAEKVIIGIRPGEKMHEILITPEEARHTVDFNNYFIILPEDDSIFNIKERYSIFLEQGVKLPINFLYSSDKNDLWYSHDEFRKIAG